MFEFWVALGIKQHMGETKRFLDDDRPITDLQYIGDIDGVFKLMYDSETGMYYLQPQSGVIVGDPRLILSNDCPAID